jgi:hypothetical protein
MHVRERSGGRLSYHHVVKVVWHISDGRGNVKTVTSIGEAIDTGDKGAAKAFTQARKTAYLATFAMSTGDPADDPDLHAVEETVKPSGADELAELLNIVGVDLEPELMAALKEEGLTSSADLVNPKTMRTARAVAQRIKDAAAAWEESKLVDVEPVVEREEEP